MIGDQKTKDDGFVSVATKVPKWVADLLQILAKGRGMEVYELLQLLINAFISAAKHDGPVPPEIRLLIDTLKLDTAYCKAFNFASPAAVADIAQMVLILQQRDPQGKPLHGFGLCMIDRPYMEDARMTLCVDDILERIVEVAMRGLYRELRQIGVGLQSESMRETLTIMCDAQHIINLDEQDRQELPQMGNYHDYGKVIEYGNRYKRKPHRTPDSLAQQQTIRFDEEDATTTDMPDKRPYGEKADEYMKNLEEQAKAEEADDMEKEMGFKPFDQEW